MVMAAKKFKTNAKCGGCVSKIGTALEQNGVKVGEWSLDLTDPQKLLTVNSVMTTDAIVAVVAEAGFKAEEVK